MSFTVENLEEKNMVKLVIESTAEEFEAGLNTAYNKNKSKISLPGFRKGKAPRKMIEKMYGAEVFYEDAANSIIPDAYAKAADECGLELVSQPKINVTQLEAGKPFIFEAVVATKPEVELGQYKGVEVTKADTEATDADVEEELKRVQEQNSRTVAVTDRAVKDGDNTVIDFEGFVDGVAFEGGKGTDYPLTIGSHSFIDTFEDQIVGHKAGDTFDVNVTFPDGYGNDMDGKAAVFKTTLNYIKIPVEAEYNDALVAANTSYKTTAEYEESIRSELKASNEATALTSAQNVVMTNVINKATIENIPAEEVSSLADEIITQLKSQASNYGIDYATFIQYYYGYEDEDSFKEYVNQICQESVKEKKVVCAVAKAENITIDLDDETAYIKKLAEENDATEDSVKEQYSSQDLMYYTLADKVMTFLLDNGKKTETTTEAATEATSSEEETTTEAITEAN